MYFFLNTKLIYKIYRALSSINFGIFLLIQLMIVIFIGTLDQVELGIYNVQTYYFKSWIIVWRIPFNNIFSCIFIPKMYLPLLGGSSLGSMLIINLFLAHLRYYRSGLKKINIILIHYGLIMLILSAFLTSISQEDSQIEISEGSFVNYSEYKYIDELVVISKINKIDTVFSIPDKISENNKILLLPRIDFFVRFENYNINTNLGLKSNRFKENFQVASQGMGLKLNLLIWPILLSNIDSYPKNTSCYFSVITMDENFYGTWLATNIIDQLLSPQLFQHDGKTYKITLRSKRSYSFYVIELIKCYYEYYPNTEIPKNFSSLINIISDKSIPPRQNLIYMNNPLRFENKIYYQSMLNEKKRNSTLQVVENFGKHLPYISTAIITFGLIGHSLSRFVLISLKNVKK